MQLSRNEYAIMHLLWKEKRPLSRAELLKGTVGRNWNPASIHLILNSMLSKGVIKITDEEKKYGRTYETMISEEEFTLQCIDEGLPGRSDEEKLFSVVAALVNRPGITEKEIQSLEQLLNEKRAALKAEK